MVFNCKRFFKKKLGYCIETLNLPLLVTSNLLTIVIQACRSTSSPTSRPNLFPGVWLLSGCSQDQSFCSSPFRYLLLWELHRIRLRSRLFLPQIFKIQRAYVYAYAYATMTWESTLRYINTLAKSDFFWRTFVSLCSTISVQESESCVGVDRSLWAGFHLPGVHGHGLCFVQVSLSLHCLAHVAYLYNNGTRFHTLGHCFTSLPMMERRKRLRWGLTWDEALKKETCQMVRQRPWDPIKIAK